MMHRNKLALVVSTTNKQGSLRSSRAFNQTVGHLDTFGEGRYTVRLLTSSVGDVNYGENPDHERLVAVTISSSANNRFWLNASVGF